MPSATAGRNLPYPLGTDRVMDGDDQIRKLAQSVENMVQTGTATVQITTSGTAATLAVTFPVPFSAPPVVVASYTNLAAQSAVAVSPQGATATGFTMSAIRNGTGPVVCSWIAVGPVVAVS